MTYGDYKAPTPILSTYNEMFVDAENGNYNFTENAPSHFENIPFHEIGKVEK